MYHAIERTNATDLDLVALPPHSNRMLPNRIKSCSFSTLQRNHSYRSNSLVESLRAGAKHTFDQFKSQTCQTCANYKLLCPSCVQTPWKRVSHLATLLKKPPQFRLRATKLSSQPFSHTPYLSFVRKRKLL
jgi:hypothetical protein